MTTEEKAKAYDEALEKARGMIEDLRKGEDILAVSELESMFPELAESEDERISREISEFIVNFHNGNYVKPYDYTIGSWLAWLEIQSGSIKIKKGKNYLCTKTHKYGGVEWIKDTKYYASDNYTLVNQRCKYYCPEYSKEEHNNLFEEVKYDDYVEKQGEQKPNDKVEPKFHEGEWYVDKQDGTTLQITKVLENTYKYITNTGKEYCCTHYSLEQDTRPWTIQDVKDGDVLARNYGMKSFCIFARFNGITDNHQSFLCYCGLEDEGLEQELSINGYNDMPDGYVPATKEQRELLFQKIHEAGYEWDVEKKKLKKIEEEYDGEDYGIDSLFHAQRILEKTLGEVDGYQTDDGILSHKCAISAVKKLYEQKSAECDTAKSTVELDDCINRLKSLKQKLI